MGWVRVRIGKGWGRVRGCIEDGYDLGWGWGMDIG